MLQVWVYSWWINVSIWLLTGFWQHIHSGCLKHIVPLLQYIEDCEMLMFCLVVVAQWWEHWWLKSMALFDSQWLPTFFPFLLWSALFIEFSYNCIAMTMYQSLLIAIVSLLYSKTRAWRSKCNCSLRTSSQLFNQVLNDNLMSETRQLIIDSCIIFIPFLCYIHQLLVLVAVLHSSCWCVAQVLVLLHATPIPVMMQLP